MLTVTDIRHAFENNRVLNGVSFTIEDGSIVGLIGPSGGGKSVLLKILGGVLHANHGVVKITVGTDDLHPKSISLMFQEGALFDSLNVFDNIAFPIVGGRVPAMILPKDELCQVHEKVNAILARVGLSKASAKFPGQLSGGMRRRVSLARALVSKPEILLLDDPTAGLDPVASGVIMELILEMHEEYRPTTVLVSHDLRRLLPVVDSILALFDGRIIFSGSINGLLEKSAERVKGFVSCRYDFGHAQ